MAFHVLPLKRNYVEIPKEYCYLVISKYRSDHFKPEVGKKHTRAELKQIKEYKLQQQETIEQLDTGYCNLYNNNITLSTILDSYFTSYLEDSNAIIYRINPISSYKRRDAYQSKDRHETSEFKIIAKFENKEELINQIYKDGLLNEFSAVYFDNYCYANEGYNLKIYDYFQYIKENFKDTNISLQDIMLNNDCYHAVRGKFNRKDTYDNARENIRYLIDNDLIKYFKENDYYKSEVIIGLIECGLSDIALKYIELLEEYDTQSLLKNKKFDIVLKKWSTNDHIKEMIKKLDIKLSGLVLNVKDESRDNIIETKNFNNIGEIKTYLIKKYDIPFEKIANKDICDISYHGNNINYSFEII
jgi:hypothetical protein